MNLNEAKKILSENNYEVIDEQQVNEWVTPMRFSYIIKFGQIQGEWEEEVKVLAYSIIDAAEQAAKMRNENERYRHGAILSIRMDIDTMK